MVQKDIFRSYFYFRTTWHSNKLKIIQTKWCFLFDLNTEAQSLEIQGEGVLGVLAKFFWGGYLRLSENLGGFPFSRFFEFLWPNFSNITPFPLFASMDWNISNSSINFRSNVWFFNYEDWVCFCFATSWPYFLSFLRWKVSNVFIKKSTSNSILFCL